jgi:SAM-dependent methyltransferase
MSAKVGFTSWEDAVLWLRAQPEQQELVKAAYYDDPLILAAERFRVSTEWQAIRQYLAGYSGAALDIGAGRGIASYSLAKEDFTVTALEPDASDLVGAGAIHSLADEAQLTIKVVQEFSERLPFLDASFDVVFARAVLHHTTNLEKACHEIFRVLKPGGRFIAVREHVISKSADLAAFFQLHPLHKLYGGENAFMLRDYKSAIKKAGFVEYDVLSPLLSPINYFPYTQDTLRADLVGRLPKILHIQYIAKSLLAINLIFKVCIAMLSLVDSRPGRLYSFVSDKPEKNL